MKLLITALLTLTPIIAVAKPAKKTSSQVVCETSRNIHEATEKLNETIRGRKVSNLTVVNGSKDARSDYLFLPIVCVLVEVD